MPVQELWKKVANSTVAEDRMEERWGWIASWFKLSEYLALVHIDGEYSFRSSKVLATMTRARPGASP